ncbi:MAG: mechanosensitive ion channel family protein [Crocinitomicaceae bacterium]|nr:mechanosensitive ion channel family protein [Crocinitomicaceae bacterium]
MQLDLRTWIILGSIFIGAIIVTRVMRWLITRSYKAASKTIRVDPTRYRFSKNALSFIIWMIAFGAMALYIPELKALAITLFAGAGIIVAVIGFAAQQAFANIVGGIFIVIFKPFRVGDLIRVGDQGYGEVEDITLRHTVIVSFENKRIIIPNSVMSEETIINESIVDAITCRFVEVGISYNSDIKKAVKILQEVAMAHPDCIDHRTKKEKADGEPQVVVRVYGFGDSSVNLRALVWTDDPMKVFKMHSEINVELKRRFDEEGIEIPFPHRTVVFRKDIDDESNKERKK